MSTLGWLVAVGAALWLIAGLVWLLGPATTDRRHLRPSPAVRSIRRVRSTLVTAALAPFTWPHLVDVALGTHRTPVGGTPSEIVWTSGAATLRRYRPATGVDAAHRC